MGLISQTAVVEILRSMWGDTTYNAATKIDSIGAGTNNVIFPSGTFVWNAPANGIATLVNNTTFVATGIGQSFFNLVVYDVLGRPFANLGGGTPNSGFSTVGLLVSDRIYHEQGTEGVHVLNFSISVRDTYGTVQFNIAMRNAIVSALTTGARIAFLHATLNCNLKLYSGTPPATADLATTGTLLATIPLKQTNFYYPTPQRQSLQLTATVAANAVATGTIGYARLVAANGCTIQCTAGTGGDLTLDADTTTAAAAITLTDASISFTN